VLYINFSGFEKYRVSAQNTKGLPFSFTEKRLLEMKTGWKSVSHPREAHTLAQLDITVFYTIF
jgi:hypothetical protein